MDENFSGIGKRIAQKMEELGVSQKDVYSVTGFSKTTMSNYVNGRRMPNTLELYKLAKFFSVSMEWLLTGKDTIRQANEFTSNENHLKRSADLPAEDLELLAKFHQLTERQKGRIEGRIEEMLGETSCQPYPKSSVSKNGEIREEGAAKEQEGA